MSLGQIIRKKREELGLTLDEVSLRSSFSKPYLSTIETGKVKNPPSDQLLKKLEAILQFEPGLLLHVAHMERLPADIRQCYETAEAENLRWRKLFKNLIDDKTDLSAIDAVIEHEELKTQTQGQAISAGHLVPIINKVAAGYPVDFNDMDYPVGIADDYVRCPDLHDPNAFAVRVIGDSMQPKYREGDIVVFSPAAEVHSGDDCFVRFKEPHETTFKRVFLEQDGSVRLLPRNEKYPPLSIDADRVNGIYRAIIKYERL